MKNRVFALFIALALIVSLAACGGGGKTPTDESGPGSSGSVVSRFDDLTNTSAPGASSASPASTESLPEEGTDEYWFAKAAALDETTAEQYGLYGDSFKWYYGDGVMAVRGTGTLEALENASDNIGKMVLNGLPEGDITVVIEDGCTAIGKAAFYECNRLTNIVIADSVKVLKEEPFGNCNGLKKVTLPQSVIVMGTYVFYGCRSLAEVTMPDELTYMAYDVFRKCSSNTLKQIHWRGQTYNSSDSFVEAVKAAGIPTDGPEPTIDDNSGVMDDIHIRVEGDTLYFSGKGTIHRADFGNYRPINVVVEPGVIGIGEETFYGCAEMTSITLPEGLTAIGENAFSSCGLTSITLPRSVKTIDSGAFNSCRNLASVTLPEGLESIGDYTFANCAALTSITLPEGVKAIGYSAFGSCTALTSIALPDSLESIGDYAFSECHSLTAVTIPDGVKSVGGNAFGKCVGLTSVTLSNNLESIEQNTFNGSGLTSIIIPDSVKTIGSYAFGNCSNLSEVTIGTGVTGLMDTPFYQCPALTKVKAPNSLQEAAIKSGMDLSVFEWY